MEYRNASDQFLADYVRHGMTPFFGLPLVDSSDPGVLGGCRAVLLGIPHDAGTSQRPGARFAPYSIRRVSFLVANFAVLRRAGHVVDGGNIPAPVASPTRMRDMVERHITTILDAGATTFVAGGDHSVTLPILRATAKKHGPLAVVHVDAHPDTGRAAEFLSDDPYHHGAPLRHALEEGLIAAGQLHQIGVRVAHDEELARAHAIKIYSVDEIQDRGVADVVRRVRAVIGTLPTYVTFDVDAVDPSFAPGTGTPVPGGLSSREALRLVRLLGGSGLVGMDVVETLPALDHADLTSLLAASLLGEGIAALGTPHGRDVPLVEHRISDDSVPRL
jgi:agmatinase